MKYIDAEKLKYKIERLKEPYQPYLSDFENGCREGRNNVLDDIFSFIISLQQEQESIAERFARIVRGNLIGIDKEVQQKFEQLYFEVTGNKMYAENNVK